LFSTFLNYAAEFLAKWQNGKSGQDNYRFCTESAAETTTVRNSFSENRR
jgi:hypothetical protein